jgi:rhamnosyltransferase
MEKNEVAVLLATYNGEKYIQQQLDSIINQTYKNIKIYIHDDGSSDNTLKIINFYKKKYPAIINLLHYEKTGSAKNNFLSLLKKTNERYVMFSDQDDYWKKDKIEKTIEQMLIIEKECNSIPVCIYTDMSVVDEKLNLMYDSFLDFMKKDPKKRGINDLLRDNVVAGCTCMINRKCIDLCNNYYDINNIKMHDWWVALIARYTGRLFFLNLKTSLYRQHSSNVVGVHNNKLIWLKKIIKNILTGKQIQSSKKGIRDIINISIELNKFDALNKEDESIIRMLANINKYSKLKRMSFFYQNNIIKKDLKNIWKIVLV